MIRSRLFPVFFIGILMLMGTALSAQVAVSGRVVHTLNHDPIAGVSIQAVGDKKGAVTDSKGFFALQTTGDSLFFSHVGFAGYGYRLSSDEAFLTIELQPSQNDLPVYTTSVISTQPEVWLRVPAAISRINTAALRRDDGLSPVAILNRVPGVFMQNGTYNTNRITIRGIGNRSPFGTSKIRAYLDDIPLTNGVGETTLEDLDLTLFSEVVIWKGPSASTYGAGLGGVIQLKTLPDFKNWTPLQRISSTLQTGSFGQVRSVTNFNYQDKSVRLALNYNNTHSDGYRANNRYDRSGFSALGQIKAGDRHLFTAFINLVGVDAFIPSSLNFNDFIKTPKIAAANWARVKGFEDYTKLIAGITHRYIWQRWDNGRELSSSVTAFTSNGNSYKSQPFNILRQNTTSRGFRAVAEYRRGANRREANLSAGIEYFNELYLWQTNATKNGVLDTLLSDNKEVRRYYNLFVESHLDLGSRWFSTLGVNYNHTRYQLSDYFTRDKIDLSGSKQFNPILSPRLSLGYRLQHQISFFGTLGHGFSAPTLQETLAPSGAINPNIRPEQGWNLEVGSRGSNLGGKLSYEVSVFRMLVSNLLVARRTAEDQYVGVNAGKTVHAGVEAAANYREQWGKWNVNFYGSYTYARYRFKEFIDAEKDYSGNALTGTPPHHITGGIETRAGFGLYSHLGYEWVDRYPVNDVNSVYNHSYNLWNLRLGWRKKIGYWEFDLYGGVQNLFDFRYASMIQVNALGVGTAAPRFYYPGLPRNYYLGLQLAFGK
jgi:iron complex outermembrane receptor protein